MYALPGAWGMAASRYTKTGRVEALKLFKRLNRISYALDSLCGPAQGRLRWGE